MDFKETFHEFLRHKKDLKAVSIASCDLAGRPNSAAKMLIDILPPDKILFLDYKFTQTYANIQTNPRLSISFMNDDTFTGYRASGVCEVLERGMEYETAQKSWEKRLIAYEADRILKRIKGNYSTREAENKLPKDFVIVKFTAKEASVIKADRFFRSRADEKK